jgi:N-acetylneuraminic acid mutarotase
MKYELELKDYWSIKTLNDNYDYLPNNGATSAVDLKNNIAYIFGGFNAEHFMSLKLIKFDLNTEEFEIYDELDVELRINHEMHFYNNKIYIIGGLKYLYHNNFEMLKEIIIYDIINKNYEIIEFNSIEVKARYTSFLDSTNESIYLYTGTSENNFYKFCLKTKLFEKITPKGKSFNERSGMISQFLPNGKALIFSGFGKDHNNIMSCFNNYYLYDTNQNINEFNYCNEVVGRTFSKSFIIDEYKKVVIYGGSINGMEDSGFLYMFDYEKNKFEPIYVQTLPVNMSNKVVVFSGKSKKMYYFFGTVNNKETYEIFILDFNKIPKKNWIERTKNVCAVG